MNREDILHAHGVVWETMLQLENPDHDRNALATRLEFLGRLLVNLNTSNDAEVDSIAQDIQSVSVSLISNEPRYNNANEAGKLYDGKRGRPRFDVSENQLTFLVENNFTRQDISNIMGVWLSTTNEGLRTFYYW